MLPGFPASTSDLEAVERRHFWPACWERKKSENDSLSSGADAVRPEAPQSKSKLAGSVRGGAPGNVAITCAMKAKNATATTAPESAARRIFWPAVSGPPVWLPAFLADDPSHRARAKETTTTVHFARNQPNHSS